MEFVKTDSSLIHWGIKGMKWGVRRYENPDGTLTEAGKKRYSKEIQRNNQRKPKDRADEDALRDPAKWVKEDMETRRNIVNSARDITNSSRQLVDSLPKKKNKRLDLSNKSDKELRDEINRELLERQYNDVFNTPKTNKGREAVKSVLSGTGAALSLASAAVSIALGIHTLRNG